MIRTAIVLVSLSLVAAACGVGDGAQPAYDIHPRPSTEGEAVLELVIRNEGTQPLQPGDSYQAVFLIQSEDGPARASASFEGFPPVEPGDTGVVFTWSAPLDPGIYSVVWGEKDRAVGATLHIEETSFGMSGPHTATMPEPIVPASISPIVDQAMRDVEAHDDHGEAIVSGVRMGIPDPDTLVIEITTTSEHTRRVYTYHQTPDGLELATLEETPPD